MEWNERIAAVRKAAGLTQEQLGERVGVTRQAVSKWESGQTVPDLLTAARLCEALHVSTDYILLGREPVEDVHAEPAYFPEHCPCCGREVSGTICPTCGYPLPTTPPRGARYAIVDLSSSYFEDAKHLAGMEKYCGMPHDHAAMLNEQLKTSGTRNLLRRGLTDGAAQYIASHLMQEDFSLRIVQDAGEEDDALVIKEKAMELPDVPQQHSGLGFWGVVAAIIVALLILSFL